MSEIIEESWTDISGYTKYQCSKEGLVRNKKTKRVLKPYPNFKGGYDVVDLTNVDGRRQRTVHRIVAETFLEPREGCNIVDHINGCRTDNSVTNLRFTTSYGNNINRQGCKYYMFNKFHEKWQCYWSTGVGTTVRAMRKTEEEAKQWVENAKLLYPHQY